MISVGIFTGYYPMSIDETIQRIEEDGFSCVQLDVAFKDCDIMRDGLTKEKAIEIRNKFRKANLPIVSISAYTNFIHPDPIIRQKNIDYLKTLIHFARDLGCSYVASETGTYNTESDWVWDERNASEEVYQETLEVIKDIVSYAKEHDVTFVMENYINNVIGTIEQIERVIADVNSEHLGLICDPTNYFTDHNIHDIDNELIRIFDRLSPYMKIAHAKDCVQTTNINEKHAAIDAKEDKTFRGSGGVELPAAGLGVLNYPLYLELLSKYHPNIPLIIEHLDEGDIPRAKTFIDDVLMKVGG
jgi:sugar phosphate isomerase/epimerase